MYVCLSVCLDVCRHEAQPSPSLPTLLLPQQHFCVCGTLPPFFVMNTHMSRHVKLSAKKADSTIYHPHLSLLPPPTHTHIQALALLHTVRLHDITHHRHTYCVYTVSTLICAVHLRTCQLASQSCQCSLSHLLQVEGSLILYTSRSGVVTTCSGAV